MAAKKFTDMVHYVCWKCQDPAKLGATKLNKILWYADSIAYENHGRAITDEQYVKRQYGPAPKTILSALRELEREGRVVSRNVDFFGNAKREFFAVTPAPISDFSPEEISLIDSVVEAICDGHTARSISDLSHNIVWEAAEIGEVIPLGAVVMADSAELLPEDEEWAQRAVEQQHDAYRIG